MPSDKKNKRTKKTDGNSDVQPPQVLEKRQKEQEMDGMPIYVDTGYVIPGLTVYVIEKVAPTKVVPYATFRSVPRTVVQVHDTGVNKGATFLSYRPVLKKTVGHDRLATVDAEECVFYSPLTKEQADYTCKQLNAQMKLFYEKKLVKQKAAIPGVARKKSCYGG